jgi:hypothetical protein
MSLARDPRPSPDGGALASGLNLALWARDLDRSIWIGERGVSRDGLGVCVERTSLMGREGEEVAGLSGGVGRSLRKLLRSSLLPPPAAFFPEFENARRHRDGRGAVKNFDSTVTLKGNWAKSRLENGLLMVSKLLNMVFDLLREKRVDLVSLVAAALV